MNFLKKSFVPILTLAAMSIPVRLLRIGQLYIYIQVEIVLKYPTKNKAAFSRIILLIKNVYSRILWQFTTKKIVYTKNAGFYTWIMAIRVSYFRSGKMLNF